MPPTSEKSQKIEKEIQKVVGKNPKKEHFFRKKSRASHPLQASMPPSANPAAAAPRQLEGGSTSAKAKEAFEAAAPRQLERGGEGQILILR